MARYAAATKVPAERTRQEIEAALKRYGADQFISGWEANRAMIGFRVKNRHVRFELPVPAVTGTPSAQRNAEQEIRQRWRALLLVIKAKLEAIESSISTFENEFLAHIVLPNNRTVADVLLPQIANAYKTGQMPKLLGDGAVDAEVVKP